MTKLVEYKIYHQGKAQQIMIEPQMVGAIKEIAMIEKVSLRELCNLISRTCKDGNIAGSIRVFVCTYYRNLALVLPSDYVDSYKKTDKEPLSTALRSIVKDC